MEKKMAIKPYGSTSGRIHGKSGYKVRPSSKTVDAHCHLHVQEAADIVQGLFDQLDVPAFRHSNTVTTNQNVQQIKDRFMDLTDVETRLKKIAEKQSSSLLARDESLKHLKGT